MSSTKFVFFFDPIGKRRWPPWPLIGWDIFDFSETAERNSTKLGRKQDINVLYQVCVFRVDRKNKMAALHLIGWHIFYFFFETDQQNSSKLDRKQDLNVLFQCCVFRVDRKNKMAAPAFDWLRPFRLLLWNRPMEFNETWQEARSQRPLPSLCCSGGSEKQVGCPKLWLAGTYSNSPLKLLNGILRNLTGSKISMSSTKFVLYLGQSEKQECRPGESVKKVALCTQVHNMWPLGPLVCTCSLSKEHSMPCSKIHFSRRSEDPYLQFRVLIRQNSVVDITRSARFDGRYLLDVS